MKKKFTLIKLLLPPLLSVCIITMPAKIVTAQGTASVYKEPKNYLAETNSVAGQNTISLELFMQKFQHNYNVYFSYQSAALKEIKVVDTDKDQP